MGTKGLQLLNSSMPSPKVQAERSCEKIFERGRRMLGKRSLLDALEALAPFLLISCCVYLENLFFCTGAILLDPSSSSDKRLKALDAGFVPIPWRVCSDQPTVM